MNTTGLMTSTRDDWRTPGWLASGVEAVLDGIGLDPCGSAVPPQMVKAGRIITPPEDGLAVPWPRGTVFMNPPYGRAISAWVDKYMRNWTWATITSGIALVPARTDTKWWVKLTAGHVTVAFLKGRMRFNDDDRGAATFPSALVLHTGDTDVQARFYHYFEPVAGIYMRVWEDK